MDQKVQTDSPNRSAAIKQLVLQFFLHTLPGGVPRIGHIRSQLHRLLPYVPIGHEDINEPFHHPCDERALVVVSIDLGGLRDYSFDLLQNTQPMITETKLDEKRYLCFGWYQYEANGGTNDIDKSFDTKEEALKWLSETTSQERKVYDRIEDIVYFINS